MKELVFKTKQATRRFSRKHIKWILPVVGLMAMASILAVAANIPVPSGSASRFVPGVPTAPTSLVVQSKTASQTLSITFTAAGANGGTITSYQYTTDNGATWRTRTDGGGTSTTMTITQLSADGTALVNGTDYYIRIRAVSNIGQGLASASVTDWPIGAPVTAVIEGPSLGFTSSDYIYDMEVDSSGNILVAGSFTGGIKRFYADGSVDTTFNPGNEICLGLLCNTYTDAANGIIYTIDIDYSGKIMIGGSFTTYNSLNRYRIARLNSDGSLDTSFSNGFNNTVRAIESYPTGDYAVGGSFTEYGASGTGTSKSYLARVGSTGTIVSAFNTVSWAAGGSVLDLVVSPTSGNVTAVGSFTSVNGSNLYQYAVRFKYSDGSLDTTFQVRSSGPIYTIETPPNSNLPYYIGGDFTTVNNGAQTRNRLASVNASGTDSGWNPNVSTSGAIVYDLNYHSTTSGDRIGVAGNFATVAGVSRTDYAVLDTSGVADSFAPTVDGVGQVIKQLRFGEYGIGGVFMTTVNSVTRYGGAILESSGSLADGIALGSASMKVSFTGSSSKAQPITTLQYSTDGGTTWRDRGDGKGASVSPVTITTRSSDNVTLVNGTSYNVRIRLVNSVNTTSATGTPSGTPCGAPTWSPTIYEGNGASSGVYTDTTPFEYARAFAWASSGIVENGCVTLSRSYAGSTEANPKGNLALSVGGLSYVVGQDTMLFSNFTTSTSYNLSIWACNIAGCGTPYSTSKTTATLGQCTESLTICQKTTVGAYTVHAIEASDTFSVAATGDINYMIVGGGGTGNKGSSSTIAGGGGGAGGIAIWTADSRAPTSFTITPGAGGTSAAAGNDGASSSFGGRSAIGGGRGATTGNGTAGGSGGGGAGNSSSTTGGAATNGAPTANVAGGGGYAGGNSTGASITTTNRVGGGGGGGGGTGSVGWNGSTKNGDGGICFTGLSIFGITAPVGGGGGGADVGLTAGTGDGGTCSGTRVGGNRSTSATGAGGAAIELANYLGISTFDVFVGSGGGGALTGGASAHGGAGGKGIIIIWYTSVQ